MKKPVVRIHIIEDDIIVAKDVARSLTVAGYRITAITHDFESSVKRFKTKIPDLLICDINLGPGKTGIDVVRELRKIKKD